MRTSDLIEKAIRSGAWPNEHGYMCHAVWAQIEELYPSRGGFANERAQHQARRKALLQIDEVVSAINPSAISIVGALNYNGREDIAENIDELKQLWCWIVFDMRRRGL